jgi:aquaporin Z
MSERSTTGAPALVSRLTAEFVGTFTLVFAGTGAVAVNSITGGVIGHVGVALAFGLAIATMVYAFRSVSGAHFNPAVTVALVVRRAFPARESLPYILVQLAAAATASIALSAVVSGSAADLGATIPAFGTAVSALGIEVIATFFLVSVILGVVRAGSGADPWAGIAIGGTVAMCALAFGPATGASMNPARSFGPALVTSGAFNWYWLYVAGPVLGGLLAVIADAIVRRGIPKAQEGENE